jgi:DNA-binding winged helix-turn-helix (wHTH) protein
VHFEFGPFTLSPEGLAKDTQAVWLAPTPLGVLRELVASSPRAVPYPQLAAAGWVRTKPSRECIARAVHQVRRTLEQHHTGTARWVESVRTRGYRFAPRTDVTARSAPLHSAFAGGAHAATAAAQSCVEAERLAALCPERLPEIERLYRRALSLDSGAVRARRGLAECWAWATLAGNAPTLVDDAIVQLGAIVRSSPWDARSQAGLALATVVAGGDFAAARDRAHGAVATGADCHVLWFAGLVALSTGQHERGRDLVANAAFLGAGNERLRRHWLGTSAALRSGRRGVSLLRLLDRAV